MSHVYLDFSNEEMAFYRKKSRIDMGLRLKKRLQESKGVAGLDCDGSIRSKWFEAARTLEGLPRNASTHAAGVILSPVPLVDTVPLQSGGDGIYLTQWPMGDVEEQGLLKMDFLGLRNLTFLDRIRSMIHYDKGVRIDFEKIPLDDEKTFELFRAGDMTGIFQFESDGMRDALQTDSTESNSKIFLRLMHCIDRDRWIIFHCIAGEKMVMRKLRIFIRYLNPS